ncbi:rhodanese-like domain-containing protein [Perlabentimonas gracilis]|uniref:rhodanese-like domain-containing protein n=1 Tax=Perlabentimonas gracilis TaxID=2715279 RepID=UPI00140E5913|nr:rhodanese-like domain-containing protein [Perlabentimonas gracilis]NHB69408.1 rhodanese-like domain-containing protein [Perlabentimonas gracilis]
MKVALNITIFLLLSSIAMGQTVTEVTSSEFKPMIEKRSKRRSVIVDGRSTEMFNAGHIANAVNIDAYSNDAGDKLAKLKHNKTLYIYCTKTNRINQMEKILKDIGYKGNIVKMVDGITGWKANGFEPVLGNSYQAETKTPVATTKDSKVPKGKPIVQVFGNFDYNATQNAQKQYGFWFGRAHFGYEHQYSEQFAGKIIIDAGRPTTVGQIQITDPIGNELNVSNSSKEGSYHTMTLKFASLEWKPNEVIKIQAGSILQNHYITQEKFWGYRYLAPTFQDQYFGIPSADLGVIAYFTINKMFGFDLALTNGEGFRFDQDQYGDVKLAAGLNFNPIEGLQTRLFYDFTSSQNPAKPADQQLLSAFVGYKHENAFRLGGEYNYRMNHLNINEHNLFGFSIYGSLRVAEKVELFARYDNLQSNSLSGEQNGWYFDSTGNAYITGIHYNPVKGINLSINYQGWSPENTSLDFQHHILLSFEYRL